MRQWTMGQMETGVLLWQSSDHGPTRRSSTPDWCARKLRAKREMHILFLWAENCERVKAAHWLTNSGHNGNTKLKRFRAIRREWMTALGFGRWAMSDAQVSPHGWESVRDYLYL